jgi:hypothetical protein
MAAASREAAIVSFALSSLLCHPANSPDSAILLLFAEVSRARRPVLLYLGDVRAWLTHLQPATIAVSFRNRLAECC